MTKIIKLIARDENVHLGSTQTLLKLLPKDDPDFAKYIVDLGDEFCQDAVLIIPKGGKGAYLHGTNNSEFPGYGQKVQAGDLSFGREQEFMTKVRGRPMAFTEDLETYKQLSRAGRMVVKAIAKKTLKD